MEHDCISNELCDDRLLAEPPATPSRPSPSFPLSRRAREPIAVSTPTQCSTAVPQDRSGKSSQPTRPQERALFTLARFDPLKVIAWVEILQSLEPGYKHNGGHAPLSPLELNAVHELKDCEKDWLLAGLQVAARSRPWTSPFIKPRNRLTGMQELHNHHQPHRPLPCNLLQTLEATQLPFSRRSRRLLVPLPHPSIPHLHSASDLFRAPALAL